MIHPQLYTEISGVKTEVLRVNVKSFDDGCSCTTIHNHCKNQCSPLVQKMYDNISVKKRAIKSTPSSVQCLSQRDYTVRINENYALLKFAAVF